MSWAALITAILQIVGPILSQWLKELLDRWLNKAAQTLPAPEALPGNQIGHLFGAAIDRLPRLAFGRRAFLRGVRALAQRHANEVMAVANGDQITVSLGADEVAELGDLGEVAVSEMIGM